MLTKLKEKVQGILAAEAEAAHKLGLTPNAISAAGIVLAFLSALAYTAWKTHIIYLFFATILLLLSGFCDALDGAIARFFKETTPFGGFLDSLLDRYADALVYASIIVAGLCDVLWGLAALVGSLLVSYARARAEAADIKMETIGLAERPERILILTATTVASIFWLSALSIGIILLAILSNLTVLQRSIYTYKKLKKTA